MIKKDPSLKPIFEAREKVDVTLDDDYFIVLVEAIVNQQLSGKVAQVIYGRLKNLLNNELTPGNILSSSFDDLRTCGLSARKIEYIQSLAKLVNSGEVHFRGIEEMTNQEIIDMLVKIKGIGPWTAEMFLLFSLGREDVFSVLDLGLRMAMKKLLGQELTKDQLLEKASKWAPYRSYVSHFLWYYLEK
ncbi:MAG TPA: DNA-3-methyladenine glycosylase [Bacillota bacterium]|nr:DNA-3-methyladenine glycosylase [Bacillota bacterium]